MHRLLVVFAAALLCSPLPATAQQPSLDPLDALPPEPLPYAPPSLTLLRSEGGGALSEAELLGRISRAYRYHAELLQAEAQGDRQRTQDLLGQAMEELAVLLEQPGVMAHPRFRQLYRILVSEYETFYGIPPDSLSAPQGDIFEFRADAFDALEDVRDPLLEDVSFPGLPPARTEVPMTQNRLVKSSIEFLLREPEKHLLRWLSRADTYFPMIEHILREEGVPDEIKYLAMIESGLNPQAKSWASAVGMWQFMTATGRAYDLQVNAWVDERRDPEKATRAAARHLLDLYERFDDWHLALAGYNCGAGNVNRALRRVRRQGKEPTFWNAYPYLPRETRNYVPMYIAAALVASNPSAFGIDEVPSGPRYAYDHVPVEGVIALDVIARLAGTSTATIRALNPELRRGHTPPSDGAYYVRIPRGTYARFAEGYAQLPDAMKRPVTDYVVRRGDTLGEIAARYGLSVRALQQKNGLRGSLIHPGQHLVVPVPRYESDVTLAEAEPITVLYGQRVVRPIAPLDLAEQSDEEERHPEREEPGPPVVTASHTVTPDDPQDTSRPSAAASEEETEEQDTSQPSATEEAEEERTIYRVRRGDTLIEIARRHGVSVSDLRQWNGLRGSRIQAGQALTLYGAEAPAEPARLVYRVRRGDTLSEIAEAHGVSTADLRAWNDLRGSRIRSGQDLVIYRGGTSIVYRVQRGDSLGKIAREYNTSVRALKQWNGLNSNTIYPGQQLTIRT